MLDFSKPLYVLAPLAGYTDLPFRSLVKQFGVDLTVSEMISANALVHNSQKTLHMLKKSPLEIPYAVQIAGSNPNVIKGAVEILNDFDYIDVIDLNCGCPAPKIVNNLSGSSLLTDLPAMGNAIETIKRYSNKSYTSAKIRLGFNEKNHLEIARVCEQSGADFIAVHGRTRSGRFKAPVDYDAIAEIKSAVSIPVIANGDIDSVEKSNWVIEHTKCDGIMIGRAAVGKPWIFSQIKGLDDIDEKELIKKAVIEHFHQMISHYGEYGAIMFRKHLHTYSKAGYVGASAFRNKINREDNPEIILELIKSFFSD